ncbi:NUDIX domain-containing protein [Saccharomonospora viridis]|jgi:predicted NUDIX family NTP pyrophosphohydrolase|uniref:Predicted NTP pyrophosphohydrolase n=2 Tax=Saccharomonospora viridis TaxID=1852 RepID=C7MT92_SACVD|nr:NUDIX domain-containing protein [Saccharomonospora viridis]ACU96729.1 predicted NTP pyrophosphohydrolase [Saccharomonospora viridis DSM 43017]KHF42878.1 DNA mismatch repair protein MutT [Saccharomonospora viridis]SFO89435.1 Predicted NTP pyrophosphohydrolase, NUDIX family [Saccharomonospora viridis]
MAPRRSAGILLYRVVDDVPHVLLGHMGGPFWARRDAGAWTVPKGEYGSDEGPEAAARREFTEELGMPPPEGRLVSLGEVRQSGGKVVTAFALRGELDPDAIAPGTFSLEWPTGSGVVREFPEVDRVAWFTLDRARSKLVVAQRVFVDRLAAYLH